MSVDYPQYAVMDWPVNGNSSVVTDEAEFERKLEELGRNVRETTRKDSAERTGQEAARRAAETSEEFSTRVAAALASMPVFSRS